MDKLDEIINKLVNGRKRIENSIIEKPIKDKIVNDINLVIDDTQEIKKLNSVQTEIRNQIVKPVKQEISKGNWIGAISVAASLLSLIFSGYAIWLQPNIIKESQKSAVNEVLTKTKSRGGHTIDSLLFRENGMYGVLDTKKNRVTEAIYDKVEKAKEGFLRVQQFGKWGVIKYSGLEVIPMKYKSIQPDVINDYYKIELNRLYGLCDSKHKVVIPIQYKSLQFIAQFKKVIFSVDRQKFGIMDYNGKTIVEPIYERIFICSESEFTFTLGENSGLTRITGELIFETKAEAIDCQDHGHGVTYSYYKDNKAGLISREGIKLTEPVFDIVWRDKEYYDASIGDSLIRLDLKGNCLIGCEYLE